MKPLKAFRQTGIGTQTIHIINVVIVVHTHVRIEHGTFLNIDITLSEQTRIIGAERVIDRTVVSRLTVVSATGTY